MKIEFSDAPFQRSHGKAPRSTAGQPGNWAFQATTHRTGFDRELTGEIIWQRGTLTQAKTAMRAAGHQGLFAILP